MAPTSPSRRGDGDTRSTTAPRRLDLNLHCGGSAGRNAWEDPSFTGANRLPPHSRRVRSMTTPGGYARGVCLDSGGDGTDGHTEVDGGIEVTGGWTFRLFPDPHCIPISCVAADGEADDDDCEEGSQSFRSTAVPSCWTMTEASDPPRYTNVQMPFDTLYPHVPRDNPTGVYRLEFAPLAGGWRSTGNGRRRAVLHFAGVEGCFFVYLNGQRAVLCFYLPSWNYSRDSGCEQSTTGFPFNGILLRRGGEGLAPPLGVRGHRPPPLRARWRDSPRRCDTGLGLQRPRRGGGQVVRRLVPRAAGPLAGHGRDTPERLPVLDARGGLPGGRLREGVRRRPGARGGDRMGRPHAEAQGQARYHRADRAGSGDARRQAERLLQRGDRVREGRGRDVQDEVPAQVQCRPPGDGGVRVRPALVTRRGGEGRPPPRKPRVVLGRPSFESVRVVRRASRP
ncbi:hypothetical protein THAOC_31720, partial [Thalassiosira oceanica]